MKLILVLLTCLLSVTSFSQKIKKIIDSHDLVGLKKYIDSHEELYEEIYFHKEDYSVHPMVYACGTNQIDMVKLFVKNNEKIDDYHTIMSLAFAISISTGNEELINYLYEQDPNINEVCEPCHGHNAIMIATVYGNKDWYFKLRPKSEMAIISHDGNNIFHLLAVTEKYSVAIFNDLVNTEELNIDLENNFRRTPLQYAVQSGNDTIVNAFLKVGADYNLLKDLYVDAIYGGNLATYNYVDSLFKETKIWGYYDAVDPENFNTFYPIEMAIMYNSTDIAMQIMSEMMNDIIKTKNDNHIDVTLSILNSRVMEEDVFMPLWDIIQWDNKVLFKFMVEKMIKINELQIEYTAFNDQIDEEYTQLAEVIFNKFEYRAAKRKFGKEFTESLYENIDF